MRTVHRGMEILSMSIFRNKYQEIKTSLQFLVISQFKHDSWRFKSLLEFENTRHCCSYLIWCSTKYLTTSWHQVYTIEENIIQKTCSKPSNRTLCQQLRKEISITNEIRNFQQSGMLILIRKKGFLGPLKKLSLGLLKRNNYVSFESYASQSRMRPEVSAISFDFIGRGIRSHWAAERLGSDVLPPYVRERHKNGLSINYNFVNWIKYWRFIIKLFY